MVTKVEFISIADISDVSPTVLATYTKIYDPKFSDEENNSPVGYFVQSPRTLSFELDNDSFLTDDVYDSSNDLLANLTTLINEAQYKSFCDKAIKVYENDVYTFCGVLLPNDLSFIEDENKMSFKFSDLMIFISNIVDLEAISIMSSSIKDSLDDLIYYAQYVSNGNRTSEVPLVQAYSSKGNIYWPSLQFDTLYKPLTFGENYDYIKYFLSEEVNYFDIIRVYSREYSVPDGDWICYYRYVIETYDKTGLDSTYESSVFDGTEQSLLVDSCTIANGLMETDLVSRGYSSPFTYVTAASSLTKTNGDIYNVQLAIVSGKYTFSLYFTGYAFIDTLTYVDNTTVKYSEMLDIVTIINNLQIQVKIDSGVPKFYITNKDSVSTDRDAIDENDMIQIEGERLEIENADYSIFDLLEEDFKNSIIPDIKEFYKQYSINTNRLTSFTLSNIFTDYSLQLDDQFTYDSTDWKVARISKESERVQNVEAWIISKGIEVLFPSDSGRSMATGSTIEIQWRTIAIGSTETVKIELYKTGVLDRVIIASTTNTGSYSWDTTGVSPSTEYKVKIILISDIAINDESDEYFTLS